MCEEWRFSLDVFVCDDFKNEGFSGKMMQVVSLRRRTSSCVYQNKAAFIIRLSHFFFRFSVILR